MAKNDDTIPVEHGLGSAAAITAGETGKGLVSGTLGGSWRGAVIGGLICGLSAVGLFSLFGAGIATMAIAGGIFALPGALLGAGLGAPTGAVVGTARGVGEGIDRVGRDHAAAQLVRNQEMTALAQMETARAMQARVMERMANVQAQPQISKFEHQGQGVPSSVTAEEAMGAYTQKLQQEQAAQLGAEAQRS